METLGCFRAQSKGSRNNRTNFDERVTAGSCKETVKVKLRHKGLQNAFVSSSFFQTVSGRLQA